MSKKIEKDDEAKEPLDDIVSVDTAFEAIFPVVYKMIMTNPNSGFMAGLGVSSISAIVRARGVKYLILSNLSHEKYGKLISELKAATVLSQDYETVNITIADIILTSWIEEDRRIIFGNGFFDKDAFFVFQEALNKLKKGVKQ